MIKNIRSRPAKRSLIEMPPHRCGIHYRPPCDIDQHRVRLHQRKLRLANHPPRSRSERYVYGYRVAFSQEFIHRSVGDPELRLPGRIRMTAGIQNPDSERRRAARDFLSDSAKPDETER